MCVCVSLACLSGATTDPYIQKAKQSGNKRTRRFWSIPPAVDSARSVTRRKLAHQSEAQPAKAHSPPHHHHHFVWVRVTMCQPNGTCGKWRLLVWKTPISITGTFNGFTGEPVSLYTENPFLREQRAALADMTVRDTRSSLLLKQYASINGSAKTLPGFFHAKICSVFDFHARGSFCVFHGEIFAKLLIFKLLKFFFFLAKP